jgi:hypothetical protein
MRVSSPRGELARTAAPRMTTPPIASEPVGTRRRVPTGAVRFCTIAPSSAVATEDPTSAMPGPDTLNSSPVSMKRSRTLAAFASRKRVPGDQRDKVATGVAGWAPSTITDPTRSTTIAVPCANAGVGDTTPTRHTAEAMRTHRPIGDM